VFALRRIGFADEADAFLDWVLDAFEQSREEEPAKQRDWRPANPLFQLHNAIITPHAAYYSEESIGAVRRIAAEEAARELSGLPALSPVKTIAA
jgi:D-3-phosphoglycerate dehydrogenase